MLPGFRFLFAAIVLSMSVLVFGLGAAALLRAAHEQFASIPARRAPPEPVFAQQTEAPVPTLALLRADPPAAEKAPVDLAAASEPATAANPTPPVESEKLAALKPEDIANPDQAATAEAAEPEAPAAETTPATPAVPVQAEAPAASDKTKIAGISDPAPPANEAAPTPIEPADAQASPESSTAAMKIATLGGPEVAIRQPASAKATDAKPEHGATRKRAHAQRLKERRRAARAPLTAAQQPADPFAPQTVTRRTP